MLFVIVCLSHQHSLWLSLPSQIIYQTPPPFPAAIFSMISFLFSSQVLCSYPKALIYASDNNLLSGPNFTAYTPSPLNKASHCSACMQAEEGLQIAGHLGVKSGDPGFARFQQGSPAVAPSQAARCPPQPTQVIAAIACRYCTRQVCCRLCMHLRLHVEDVGEPCLRSQKM